VPNGKAVIVFVLAGKASDTITSTNWRWARRNTVTLSE